MSTGASIVPGKEREGETENTALWVLAMRKALNVRAPVFPPELYHLHLACSLPFSLSSDPWCELEEEVGGLAMTVPTAHHTRTFLKPLPLQTCLHRDFGKTMGYQFRLRGLIYVFLLV